jgi:hypothetical protein
VESSPERQTAVNDALSAEFGQANVSEVTHVTSEVGTNK